jgi:predicted ATPase/transcriptional regulator with XRE-family HTH domain
MLDGATGVNEERGTFGPMLRRLRLAARLSQEELAERARLSVVSISALERGRRRAPYRETIRLLGDALNLSDEQRGGLEAASKRLRVPEGAEAADEPESVAIATTLELPADGARHNLPVLNTRLIGRDDDVAAVVALVREHRFVTLLGTGGIGKTRTAVAAGEALLASAAAGVWFVDLAPLARGSFVADAVARALGVKESPDRPLAQSLLAFLKARHAVLILDNCEHVIAEAAALADELLRGCEHLKILATSRERLRLSGERAYHLPSLALPSRKEASRLSAAQAQTYAALALFVERARAADGRFALDDTNAPVVAEICRLLDGVALAIELAAARVRILSPSALLNRLDQRFRLLTQGDRSALPRHQTMRALLDWSYDLLTPREQRLFERLSVFADGCDLEEAGAVCSDAGDEEFAVLEVLMSLVDKSLVVTESRGRDLRYRLLESSRLYAAEKLAQHGDAERIARRHAQAYVRLAEILERERDVAPDAEWLARVEPEFENWRTALRWSSSAGGDVVLGQRLAGALRPVWVGHSTAEGRRQLEAALGRVTPQTPADVIRKLRFALAHVTLVSAEYAAALEMSMPLIDACIAAGDTTGTAFASYCAGASLVSMGRVAEGEPLLTRALDSARAQGNLRLTAVLLNDVAYGKSLGTNPAEGRVYYAEALEIWTALGSKRNVANSSSMLAENLFLSGELEAALRCSSEAIVNLRAAGYARNLIVALNNRATYLNAGDRWVDARTTAAEALALAEESEATVARTWSLHHLAATAALSSAGAVVPCAKAAQLLGYVDARLAAQGSHRTAPEQQEYDRVCAILIAALGSLEYQRLMEAGAVLTHEDAVGLGRSL